MVGGDGIQSDLNQLAPVGRLRQQLFKVAVPGARLPVIPTRRRPGPITDACSPTSADPVPRAAHTT
jgi:hypothetical protein